MQITKILHSLTVIIPNEMVYKEQIIAKSKLFILLQLIKIHALQFLIND